MEGIFGLPMEAFSARVLTPPDACDVAYGPPTVANARTRRILLKHFPIRWNHLIEEELLQLIESRALSYRSDVPSERKGL
ncbi:hypothetical protein G3545_18460 [Starkeya sp. ORNL1]|uniref:hypothetical protein n=1 Tax=Starkeya sp. ORNL1 TaxID=2709380 RepID=UPI0014645299|nr:hypothetical protein [Starkeya sp. ORNL1]QJP15459.1 hypothetical protein G3545_18460 [Starkeya sp. ORNL1]